MKFWASAYLLLLLSTSIVGEALVSLVVQHKSLYGNLLRVSSNTTYFSPLNSHSHLLIFFSFDFPPKEIEIEIETGAFTLLDIEPRSLTLSGSHLCGYYYQSINVSKYLQ